jgi:hypothetical protein
MLQISNLNHDSWQTIHYQRATVLLTELVLVYALHLYVRQGGPTLRILTLPVDTFDPRQLAPRSKHMPQHFRSYFRQDYSSSTTFTSSTTVSSMASLSYRSFLQGKSLGSSPVELYLRPCSVSSTSTSTWLQPTSSTSCGHTASGRVLSLTSRSLTASSSD